VLAPLSVAAAKRSILNGLRRLWLRAQHEAYEMYGVSTTSDCLEASNRSWRSETPVHRDVTVVEADALIDEPRA